MNDAKRSLDIWEEMAKKHHDCAVKKLTEMSTDAQLVAAANTMGGDKGTFLRGIRFALDTLGYTKPRTYR